MAGDTFYSPEMMYVLGRMYQRLNEPALAAALYRGASFAALSTQLTHKRLAEFLLSRQWYDLSEVEYRAVLATAGPEKPVHDADAYVGLARCAAGEGNDAKAAELLTTALQMAAALPNRQVNNEGEFRAEIDWHTLRHAKARGDWNEVKQRLDALAAYDTNNPEVAIDIVSALKHLGREDEARRIFGKFYGNYRKELAEDPHDPEVLNNIAWLCARCDEHLEDAARWSQEAIRLAPANAAYLDTAAEAAGRVGRWAEAVRLESAALELTPGDRFMMGQLGRFEGEMGKGK
jgi:tetratricopeptide (TPR) repeat protein